MSTASTMTAGECEDCAELLLDEIDESLNPQRDIAEAHAWATLALSKRTRQVHDELVQIGLLL